ncbi:MAG: TraB/GumN family protein [Deltaproteobacteria bacterium]|nr:TraB/GumN family protein [Deltaproteobacteria bacterium]
METMKNTAGPRRRAASVLLFPGLPLILLLLLAPAPSLARGSLWQVRTGEHVLYLLGSLHVMKKESYPLPVVMDEIYAASSALVFETDMDEMDTPAMQNKIVAYGRLPAGQTLEQQLTLPTWQLVRIKMADLKIPAAQLQTMRPWLCALTLTVTELERQGFLPEYGLDEHFYARAKQDKKKIIALESVDYQLSLFYSQSRREQENFLQQTLNDLQLAGELSSDMENAWKTGDGEKLQGLMAKSFAGYPEQYDRLVLKRNKNWLPLLEKIMKREAVTLVVVGAGHLVGPDSVVDLLRRKGYPVTQR